MQRNGCPAQVVQGATVSSFASASWSPLVPSFPKLPYLKGRQLHKNTLLGSVPTAPAISTSRGIGSGRRMPRGHCGKGGKCYLPHCGVGLVKKHFGEHGEKTYSKGTYKKSSQLERLWNKISLKEINYGKNWNVIQYMKQYIYSNNIWHTWF